MNANTMTSWPVDGLKKAGHLAFDSLHDDVINKSAWEMTSAQYSYAPAVPAHSGATSLWPVSSVSTEAIAVGRIKEGVSQHVRLVELSEASAGMRAHYRIKPGPSVETQDTQATKNPELSLTDLIYRFRHHPRIAFAQRIAARLDYLLAVSREEQPEQAPPAAKSLEGFLAFLSKNRGLAYPTIVLTPDGNVRVQWRRGTSEHFAIEFLSEDDVSFVIFAADPIHPYKTIRVSGGATVGSVMRLAAPYGVMRWAGEQDQEYLPK